MAAREYTPQRRRIMQFVMGGILAATLVLAAVVTRSANRAHRVELSPQTFTADNVSVRLPLQWRAQAGDQNDPRVIAQASEAPVGDKTTPSVVRVLTDRIDMPMSPLNYLRDSFGVLGAGDGTVLRARQLDVQNVFNTTQIGPAGAMVIGVHQVQPGEEGQFELRHDLYAAAVFPSLQVIVVHLSGAGPVDLLDQLTVEQVASGVVISDTGDAEPPQAVITLPAGIELQPPAGFVAIQKRDTNRTDRLMWRAADSKSPQNSPEQFERDWTSIEVVACLFSARDEQPEAAMQTLLLAREPGWQSARVSNERGVWRAERDDGDYSASAYLVPDRSGRALSTIFRGGSKHGPDFRQEWEALAATVKFLPASDTSQLEHAGAAASSRLLGRGDFAKIFGDRDEQWWLYTGPGNRSHIGWSNLKWQPGAQPAANVETRLRSFGGDIITRIAGDWSLGNNARDYDADLTRTETRAHKPRTLQQRIHLQRGQLAISARADTAAPLLSKLSAPPQFIPGGVLPMLIGELDPGPLLIRTDSFLDCEAALAPQPLGVIIRPGFNSTRRAEDEEQPMRCVTAEVNGAGRVSRWYFRSTGELEIVELSGGVTVTPSDLKAIHFAFGKTGPMTP